MVKLLTIGVIGIALGLPVAEAQSGSEAGNADVDSLARAAVEEDKDIEESREALTDGLDRIVERSALQYGQVRIARGIYASADGEEPSESCSIDVTVRTQEFDDMTMVATASTCAAASDMVLEGVAALVD